MTDKENIKIVFNKLNEKALPVNFGDFDDGRIESAVKESEIKKYIRKLCGTELIFEDSEKIRNWYDCKINNTPFNIKITNRKTADNISSKKGLIYALTGKVLKGEIWQNAVNMITDNYSVNDFDYGFIIVDKNTKKLYISSLKNLSIKNLVSNGNNLPFQCCWSFLDNKLEHFVENQDKQLIGKFLESYYKKININLKNLELLFNFL